MRIYIYIWCVIPEDDPNRVETCRSRSFSVLIVRIIYFITHFVGVVLWNYQLMRGHK